jgi:copper chaperone CopZ
MEAIEIQTSGTHCGSCTMLIEMTVDELEGVESVSADHSTGLARVTFDPDLIAPNAITAAIEEAGYGAEILRTAN